MSTNVYADGDCVDTNGAINPRTVRYQDADGDGYGNPAVTQKACTQPADYVLDDTDCDDTEATIYPSAPELCDGQVNTCGGILSGNEIDNDGDGYVECTIDA